MLLSQFSMAQVAKTPIKLLSSGKAEIIGTNTTNATQLSINIPAGKNRVLIVWFGFERYHEIAGENFPTDITTINGEPHPVFKDVTLTTPINGNSLFRNIGNQIYAFTSPENNAFSTNTKLSVTQQTNYINLGSSTTATTTSINYSNFYRTKVTTDDEMVVAYAIYENVSKQSIDGTNADLEPRSGHSWNSTVNFTTTLDNYVIDRITTAPAGRNLSEVVYSGMLASSRTENGANFNIVNDATSFIKTDITNKVRNTFVTTNRFSNEHDGISVRIFDFNRAGNPIPTGNPIINKPTAAVLGVRTHNVTLLPFAMPAYSGRVVFDTNGTTITGNGTNLAATNIYVIDNNSKVIFKTTVNTNGTFNIPEGIIEETSNYTIKLSNINVNVGDNTPASQLNSRFAYTRESATNTTGAIDNIGDGVINISNAGLTGLNSLIFGVKSVDAINDNFSSTSAQTSTGAVVGNILANDTYNEGNGGSATTSNVTITSVVNTTPNPSGGTTPTINTTNGNVTVPQGTPAGTYTFTYTICATSNNSPCDTATVTVVVADGYCYKLPMIDTAAKIPTKVGITALNRAGTDNNTWPTVRQSAWTALEAKTKGFVVNRVEFNSNNQPIGIATSNFVEGMMVYDTTNNCLKIFSNNTWNCYSTQTCP